MDVLLERCAGLDVHQATIVACALIGAVKGKLRKEMADFSTTAAGLAKLVAWLKDLGVTHVAMEATGVYWTPVHAALEAHGGFEAIVANAQHIKAVPGRKTDMKDAEWMARLARFGLVRKSFIPEKPIRVLRDLLRYRRTLVDEQADQRRRLIKTLESADIKLAGVLTDVLGVSGRLILRARIAGERDPDAMAKLARGQARRKRAALREALDAPLEAHQRLILSQQLKLIETIEASIATLDVEIEALLRPYSKHVALLVTIPGVDWVNAASIIAEIGVDLSSFPSPAHLAAWAGVCPGNNESAGKRKPAGARKGNPHLKTTLCNAATSAAKVKSSYFKTKYYKLKAHIGGGKATMAIAHKILVCVYHMFTKDVTYRELGADYLDKRNLQKTATRLVQKLADLGYKVDIAPLANPT